MAAASEEKVTKTQKKHRKKASKRTGSKIAESAKQRKEKNKTTGRNRRKEQTKQTAGEIADGTNSREYGRFADRKCKEVNQFTQYFQGNAGAYGSGHQNWSCP